MGGCLPPTGEFARKFAAPRRYFEIEDENAAARLKGRAVGRCALGPPLWKRRAL